MRPVYGLPPAHRSAPRVEVLWAAKEVEQREQSEAIRVRSRMARPGSGARREAADSWSLLLMLASLLRVASTLRMSI